MVQLDPKDIAVTFGFDRGKTNIGVRHISLKAAINAHPFKVCVTTLEGNAGETSHKRMATICANDVFTVDKGQNKESFTSGRTVMQYLLTIKVLPELTSVICDVTL